ncbi:MAG TPA: hypothetical protein VF250_02370 [Conexibacter sp.]
MGAVASFQGPNRVVVVPILERVELFRVVNADRPHHPALVLDLTSNYERQARPRRIERYYSVVHMAISTFTTADAARSLVDRFPGVGTYLARLRLPPGAGFCIDAPPRGAHRSLWGAPVQLAACVVEVVRA